MGRQHSIPALLSVENWSKFVTRGESWFFAFGNLYRVDEKGTASIQERWRNHPFPGRSGALFRRSFGPPPSAKDGELVDSVLISGLGRFGNGVQQFIHATSFALATGASQILYFANQKTRKSLPRSAEGLILTPVFGPSQSPRDAPLSIWRSDFFDAGVRIHSFDELGAKTCRPQLQNLYEDLLDNGLTQPETLTIHLRSGDVFGSRPHPGYGQPPLAFYTAVIEAHQWKEILIVSEDASNPCVAPLLDLAASKNLNCSVIGDSFAEATKAITKSTYLVASRGTFVPALLFLSENPKTVFVFNGDIDRIPGGVEHVYVDVDDVLGRYSDEVLLSNWSNSPEQRSLMLTYSRKNLTADIMFPLN